MSGRRWHDGPGTYVSEVHLVVAGAAFAGAAMIQWVLDGKLAFADLADGCGVRGTANVHACKVPCFMAVTPAQGQPWQLQPTWAERGNDLYLNMIDPEKPLFRLEMFKRFMDFVDRHIEHRPVVIHCKGGRSRSPSLALLWLAKRTSSIPRSSYLDAARWFEQRFPYSPGRGIAVFLHQHWDEID